MYKYLKLITLFALGFIFASCQEDDDKDTDKIPTTYNFDNADYSGQTDRLNQLAEMTNYIKTVNQGGKIELQVLLDMFENANGNANGNFTFTSTKQLRDKTDPNTLETITGFMSNLAEISGTLQAGSMGQAGLVSSGTSQYLFNENGLEYQQLIEKGLMGACFLNQITNVYLSPDKMNVDNSANVEGKNYTTMEHHWDEAFGYLGASQTWPTDVTGESYWAKYAQKSNSAATNGMMNSPKTLIDAFIKGRIAIKNKDYTERDNQIRIIIEQLELISATTAINYINGSIAEFGDDALRNHRLSEAYAFIWDLQFINVSHRKIQFSKITSLLDELGLDYYNVTIDQLNSIKNQLSEVYGLDAIKDQL